MGKIRIFPLLLAAVLTLSLLAPAAIAAEGTADTILITSVSDLISLAKSCTLDTWSQGKTVRLTCDLNLTGCGFTPIPTFGGTFDGGGFTISGLTVSAAGSNQGLFRYVQESGLVKNLTVKGSVLPGGSASNAGGVVGTNRGVVQDCAFLGSVQGSTNIGGICGVNENGGSIVACSAAGTISGEQSTGGICGRNAGTLLSCTSQAGVNTSPRPSAVLDIDSLADGSVLDTFSTVSDQTAAAAGSDALTGWQDVGGVVGYTSGIVQSCVNQGAVGYAHMGYNIGGVAGRQAGYLSGCKNTGYIQGRKDVGGIAGQCEPYVVMDASSDTLRQLRSALNRLSSLIDHTIADASGASDDISAHLTALGNAADAAREHSRDLLDRTADLVNANVEEINDFSVSVTNALDRLSPAMDDLSDTAAHLETLSDRLAPALEDLARASGAGGDTLSTLRSAMAELKAAAAKAGSGISGLKAALELLRRGVVSGNQDAAAQALAQLQANAAALQDAAGQAGRSTDALSSAMAEAGVPEVSDALAAFTQPLAAIGSANGALSDALKALLENLDPDGKAWAEISGALEDLSAAMAGFQTAFGKLSDAAGSGQDLASSLASAFSALKKVAGSGESAARSMGAAFDKIKDAVDALRENGPVTFTPVDDAYRDAGDRLYDSLADVSRGMSDLNNAVSSSSDLLLEDLKAVNRQFSLVMNLTIDALEEARDTANGDNTLSHRIEDVSDEDIAATTLGKTADSANTGTVEGDRNAGGIVGCVGMEYGLDPEDDNALGFSFSATYKSKAVVVNCVNRGSVTGKKDCVGGVAGRLDLGLISQCQNYGDVESASGDFVGGVAGTAASAIRRSYAKCTLSGRDYVGGIAGSGAAIEACAAIPQVADGREYLGAVAGYAGALEDLKNNLFLDNGVGGVDSISYAGHAQPAAFEALRSIDGVPTELVAFTLRLVTADEDDEDVIDTVVAEIPFLYGADLSLITLPETPARAGYFGAWPSFDPEGVHSDITLKAVYTPVITVLASREADGGLPLALAEGSFTDQAALTVKDGSVPGPDGTDAAPWEVALSGSGLSSESAVPLRLLSREGGTVYQYTGGQWETLPATRNGNYLITEMAGTSGIFCVVPKQNSLLPALFIAGGGLALLACLLAVRKNKGKKKQTPHASPASAGSK